MRSLTLDVYSLLQVRKNQYKNIQNTDADAWEQMQRDKRTTPHVKTICELASSH